MVSPEVALVFIVVAAGMILVGFVLQLAILYFLGMIALPLAVLSGVPMWGGKGSHPARRH